MSKQFVRLENIESLRDRISQIVRLLCLVHEAVICVDEECRIVVFNQGAENAFGRSESEVLGKSLGIFVPERMRAPYLRHLKDILTSEKEPRLCCDRGRIFVLRADQSEFSAEASVSRFDHAGDRTLTLVLRDVSEQVAAERRLLRMAQHDYLTDLPNRVLFMDRLTTAISRADRAGKPFALVFLDIDDFKKVNDFLGHAAGDDFLRGIAAHVRASTRETDTLARLGGDEFAVILEGVMGESEAVEVCLKMLHALEEPYRLGEHEVHASASAGIALYPEHGTDRETLLAHADAAMYAAKRLYSSPYVYTPSSEELDPLILQSTG